MNVKIDADFIENEANDENVRSIISGLYNITRKNLIIPYKIGADGHVYIIICTDTDQWVAEEGYFKDCKLSFFLETDTIIKK